MAIVPYTRVIPESYPDSSSGSETSASEKEEGEDSEVKDESLKGYKNWNTWKGKNVRIFKRGAAIVEIAKGRIIFPSSSASVGGVVIGEGNAGIVVFEVNDSLDPMLLRQELPNFSSGQPHLCTWPICSLRIEENGQVLGDLYSAYEDADFVHHTQHSQAGVRKRAYFSTKRKLKTEEEKLSDRLKRRADKKLVDANILSDMMKGCSCNERCCQSWSVEEVKEVRKEIYGVKFEKKLDLIYQKINASQARTDGASIAKYLRDCEDFDGDMRGDLAFEKELEHPLLNAFMNKDIFSKTVVGADSLLRRETTSSESGLLDKPFNKLSPTFYIQLDNSGNDNKNSVMMAFFSELVIRGVFKTVFMSFLIVGHTHEDVDAFFSKVNKMLSFQHISNVPQLMATMMEVEEKKALPRFITEVADYKTHALPYRKPVAGISKPVSFKFYMQDNQPMYKYQEVYGGPWLPTCGDSLWRRLDRKSKTNFSVVPPLDQEPLSSGMASNHAATEDIVTYLKAYIKHIKSIRDKTNPSSECYETDTSIIAYWEKIKSLFEESKGWATNARLPLKEGFWPRTNHGTGYKRSRNQIIITSTPEDDILAQEVEEELVERNQLFVGNLAEMEQERFVPIVDIEPGVMLLIRSSDGFVVKDCFWVAKAVSGVIRQRKPSDHIRIYEVKVEWYRPKHRSSNATDAQRYNQCLRNTQEWEKDPSPFEEDFLYVNASACVHQWKSKSRSKKLKIPESILKIARDMLDRIAQEEIFTLSLYLILHFYP
ncbi:hypothetical protein R1sor_013848 [Riccia sorocarpa]|uniref:DUF7869 domain-containing protein n=1 Tax=Riccia sorocarpa TaxID=122646 RepID=A0ABD3HAM0_9MARC